MTISANPSTLPEILPLRALFRFEMNCQIIHDSLHDRDGWTRSYLLQIDGATAAYGTLAIAGPWLQSPTIVEFYVLPQFRSRSFDLFETLLAATNPHAIEIQSNATLLFIMLHTYAQNVTSEKILFRDKQTTTFPPPAGAIFLPNLPPDDPQLSTQPWSMHGNAIIHVNGIVAAKGGIATHYNPPYVDIFMEVAQPFQKQGIGTYLVQELKKLAIENGFTPAARCNPDNLPSRKTLQKAGLFPCAHLLKGSLQKPASR